MVGMANMEEILRKIAVDIANNKCGIGNCPCFKDCDVYSDEECINRIMDYFKSVVEE